MAKGADGPCVKCWLTFTLIVVVVLVATDVWNPLPGAWDWVSQSAPMSDPAPAWQERIDGSPKSVTITGNAAIVEHRTSVEARSLSSGVRLWERRADWTAVAGGEQDAVVVVGKLLEKGYEVLDPESGAVRRRDEAAVGVWTFRNALLDARCYRPKDCTLTAWDPRGTTPLWTAGLPGIGVSILADNPELLGTRPLRTDRVDEQAAGPELMPALLGLPIDGRVHVLDTATGQVVRDLKPGRHDRIAVVGGRVLYVGARAADGTCYFTIRAHDPATDQQVWRRDGLNPRTADGAGCVQRQDPPGSRNVIVGVGADRREVIVDGYDGRQLWSGSPGQRVLAVDDRYALVHAGDRAAIVGYELTRPSARWTEPVGPKGGAALARYAALIVDEQPDRIRALDPRTGRELATLRSSARVLAVGPQGMLIGQGREIGYVRFGAAIGSPSDPGPGPGGAPDPGLDRGRDPDPDTGPGSAGPTCGGPKLEQCPPGAAGEDG